MKRLFIIALAFFLLPHVAAQAAYTYIDNAGEYSITLPDAPVGQTIWASEEKVPYLDNPPSYGAIGEHATLHITDPDTGDFFDVKMTFLHADPDFLKSLTQAKIQQFLVHDYTGVKLDKMKFDFSAGAQTLKWGTLTSYSVDQANHLLYNAENFLVGLKTILVIKIQYTLENKAFNAYYKQAAQSIKYVGQ